MNVREVLEQLQHEGYADAQTFGAAHDTLADVQSDAPWYVQSIVGCGGWIGAVFFFSFLSCWVTVLLGNLSTDQGYGATSLVIGGSLIVISTWVRRSTERMVLTQFALAVNIASQILVGVGVAFLLGANDDGELPIIAVAAVVIGMQLVLIPTYPDATLRFLSVATIVVTLNVLVYVFEVPFGVSLLAVLLAAANLVMWGGLLPVAWEAHHSEMLYPVMMALPVGLFGTLIYELTDAYYIPDELRLTAPLFTALALAAMLLWVETRTLRDYDIALNAPLALGVLGTTVLVTLAALGTPGILAALLVAVLGFRRRSVRVRGLAYGFLAGFVVFFYYNLQITLLLKSLMLMATGVIMLVGRLGLRRVQEEPYETQKRSESLRPG